MKKEEYIDYTWGLFNFKDKTLVPQLFSNRKSARNLKYHLNRINGKRKYIVRKLVITEPNF